MTSPAQPRSDTLAFRHALDSVYGQSREAVFVMLADSARIEACNKAAERMFGSPSDDLVGRGPELLCADAGSRIDLYEAVSGVARRGGVAATRCVMARRDGGAFAARTRVVAVDSAATGRPPIVLWLVREESQSNLANRDEILQRDLFRLAASGNDAGDGWAVVLERFAREFDWDYGEVWAPRGGRLKHAGCWSPGDSPELHHFADVTRSVEFASGEGLPGRVWRRDRSEWLSDVSDEPNSVFRRTFVAGCAGLLTFFAVPVDQGGRVSHVLVFAKRSVRKPDRDVATVTSEACYGIPRLLAGHTPADDAE